MRTATTGLELLEPRTLRTAFRMLREEGPLVPIAGCTDVFVSLNFGTLGAKRFLDLSRLGALRRIREAGDMLVIGTLATFSDIISSRAVRRRLPMLVSASREVGGPQIQNRGTIGGNVANGSPAGDTLPVLAAAEAVVVLGSADGERRVNFNSFYSGYRKTVMRADEIIVGFEIPPLTGAQWFRKVGTRAAQAISKVVMAAVRSERPRIALGSVAPTVVRLPRTEAALERGATIEQAQQILRDEIRPIDDLRSTADYRRETAARLVARFWRETAGQRDGGPVGRI